MKNEHAYGIPYSIFFEELFAKTYDSTKLEEDQQRIQQFYQDNGYFTAKTTGAQGGYRERRRREIPPAADQGHQGRQGRQYPHHH